jgi:hypothetical protein
MLTRCLAGLLAILLLSHPGVAALCSIGCGTSPVPREFKTSPPTLAHLHHHAISGTAPVVHESWQARECQWTMTSTELLSTVAPAKMLLALPSGNLPLAVRSIVTAPKVGNAALYVPPPRLSVLRI